jgi:large subunit ribosomal protein L28
MARVCDLTGKRANNANLISHSNRKSKKLQNVNLQYKRVWVEELGMMVRLRLSTRAIRTLAFKSLSQALADEGKTLADVL